MSKEQTAKTVCLGEKGQFLRFRVLGHTFDVGRHGRNILLTFECVKLGKARYKPTPCLLAFRVGQVGAIPCCRGCARCTFVILTNESCYRIFARPCSLLSIVLRAFFSLRNLHWSRRSVSMMPQNSSHPSVEIHSSLPLVIYRTTWT